MQLCCTHLELFTFYIALALEVSKKDWKYTVTKNSQIKILVIGEHQGVEEDS